VKKLDELDDKEAREGVCLQCQKGEESELVDKTCKHCFPFNSFTVFVGI